MSASLKPLLESIVDDLRHETSRGRVAQTIPALAAVDPQKLGVAIITVDGEVLSAGDAHEPFSIQSISKVFTLAMALNRVGDELWRRVGREASGSPFNSIVQLEYEKGIPRNPFINAGALVVCDALLADRSPSQTIAEVLQFVRTLADEPSVQMDPVVARSETATGFRNAALANYLKAFGNLSNAVEQVLDIYFQQCAIAMTCTQLARAGLFLPASHARSIHGLMLTCGLYDGSGDFACRVGLPAKSGIGGGILAIVPGRAGIAIWSPGLDPHGNSYLGIRLLNELAELRCWSIFANERDSKSKVKSQGQE